jgi:hypothetical protein
MVMAALRARAHSAAMALISISRFGCGSWCTATVVRAGPCSLSKKRLVVDLVVALEVGHIDEEGRHVDDVPEVRTRGLQDDADVLDRRLGLRRDVFVHRAVGVDRHAHVGVVGAARRRARDEQEIPDAFRVRIATERLRPRVQDDRLRFRLHYSCTVMFLSSE